MAIPTSAAVKQKEIVVGVDGSKQSIEALIRAVHFGQTLSCGVHAIMTYTIPPIPGSSIVPTVLWDPKGDAVIALERSIGQAFHSGVPELLSWSTVEGPPAKTLIDASKDATMLIVGSRGYGGVSGLMLGSVSSACAERAMCPVLVIH